MTSSSRGHDAGDAAAAADEYDAAPAAEAVRPAERTPQQSPSRAQRADAGSDAHRPAEPMPVCAAAQLAVACSSRAVQAPDAQEWRRDWEAEAAAARQRERAAKATWEYLNAALERNQFPPVMQPSAAAPSSGAPGRAAPLLAPAVSDGPVRPRARSRGPSRAHGVRVFASCG